MVLQKFGCDIVHFANFKAVCRGFVIVRTVVTTPVFSYVLEVHDCLLSGISWLSEAAGSLLTVKH